MSVESMGDMGNVETNREPNPRPAAGSRRFEQIDSRWFKGAVGRPFN